MESTERKFTLSFCVLIFRSTPPALSDSLAQPRALGCVIGKRKFVFVFKQATNT